LRPASAQASRVLDRALAHDVTIEL
jgi:hypothetical protein